MNLKQAKIILEKINRLYQSMTLDEKSIDVFEQDLMLSYTRQLYAAFSDEEDAQINVLAEAKLPKARVATKAPVSKPKPKPKVVEEVVETPPPPPPPPVEVPKPVVEVKKEVPAVAVKVEPPVVKVEAPKPPAPTPVAKPQPVVAKVSKVAGAEEQEALFEQEEVKDLSGKLGQMPVKDLNKAMGLNEKILTINELFGGDKKLFDDAMTTLNGFKTFEEAKIYLTNGIAAKYDWAAKSKSKKAKVFINLIRRRYNR